MPQRLDASSLPELERLYRIFFAVQADFATALPRYGGDSRQGTVGAALAALCQWLERHHPQAHCREGSGERLKKHGHWHRAVSAQRTAHVVVVEVRAQPGVLSERSAL